MHGKIFCKIGEHSFSALCKCQNADRPDIKISSIRSVLYSNKKANDAGTGPVPDNADAVLHLKKMSVIGLK